VILFRWRSFVAMFVLALLPLSVSADDASGSAVLRSGGGVLVNKRAVPSSVTVFSGDIVENQGNGQAFLDYQGSRAELDPETVIQLGDGEIILDHGSLTVTSLRQLRVRAGCVLATPVVSGKTIYSVKDTDNRVTVIATEMDVNLDSRSDRLKRARQPESSDHGVVHQGEQKSRDEHCGGGGVYSTPVGATGGILNSPYALGAGAAAVIGLTCWALCRSDNPASPSIP
jgi:hypothetical protein